MTVRGAIARRLRPSFYRELITMERSDRLLYLIDYLLKESDTKIALPQSDGARARLLRALLNVRPPIPAADEFLSVQDEFLREEIRRMGITRLADIQPVEPDLYIRRGDIVTLACDGIVNAANSAMLGCFCPNHGCIDNAVHTFAGVQLRAECAEIMRKQGHDEPTGRAKATEAYNLPCKYVLHTVGPIYGSAPPDRLDAELASCYNACLALADELGLSSLAFCCISTGEFGFPNASAAKIAVETVKGYKRRTGSPIKIIFDVFKEIDHEIYSRLLGADRRA